MPTIWNDLLNLFFPKLCVLCKEPLIDQEEQICLACLCDLPHTNFHTEKDNPVEQLFVGKIYIEYATSLLYYEKGGKVQRLIHAFKYHGNKKLAFLLGKQMALSLSEHPVYSKVDMLIPVPLHKKRQRKRGYNQSMCLCDGIASVWRIPVWPDILVRVSTTDTQTRKNVYERWLNVKEIFALRDPLRLQNKHILLVDDVITSGSTISACAEALMSIPGIRISVLSLAVA